MLPKVRSTSLGSIACLHAKDVLDYSLVLIDELDTVGSKVPLAVYS